MSTEDAEGVEASSDSIAEIDAAQHELQLLHQIRESLDAESHDEMMVEAVTGVIAARQAQLERSQRTGR